MSRAQVLACGGETHDITAAAASAGVGDGGRWGVCQPHGGPDVGATRHGRRAGGRLWARRRGPAGGRGAGRSRSASSCGRSGWKRGAGGPIEICIDVRRSVRRLSGYRFVRVNTSPSGSTGCEPRPGCARPRRRSTSPWRRRPARGGGDHRGCVPEPRDLGRRYQSSVRPAHRVAGGKCWPLCSPTSRPEPARRWSTCSSISVVVVIGLPVPTRQVTRIVLEHGPPTRVSRCRVAEERRSSWSWTAGSSTTTRVSETATSTATSTTWSRAGSRCGWAGDR